jgi:hypothetical protein
MIKVTLSEFIFIGMALGVVLVCLVWLNAVFRDQRSIRRERSHLFLCRICGCAYQSATSDDVTVCPACNTPNERRQMDAI